MSKVPHGTVQVEKKFSDVEFERKLKNEKALVGRDRFADQNLFARTVRRWASGTSHAIDFGIFCIFSARPPFGDHTA